MTRQGAAPNHPRDAAHDAAETCVAFPVQEWAVGLTAKRRRDYERLDATPALTRAGQELAYSRRVVGSVTRWLRRSLARRPERLVPIGSPRVYRSNEVGDLFIRNMSALRGVVKAVELPPDVLPGVQSLPEVVGHVLKVPLWPVDAGDRRRS